MKQNIQKLIEKLETKHSLSKKEYLALIKNFVSVN